MDLIDLAIHNERRADALESRVLALTAALKKFTRCDQFCPCCEVSAYPQNDTIPPVYKVPHLDDCELAALLEEE